MDLWDVLKLLVRRWYATVPLLIASLASAAWIGVASEPDYVATSYITLLPPTVREDPDSGRTINPWTVDTLMGAVVTRLNTKTQHDELAAEGLSPIWVATADYNFRQQLALEVTAESPEAASATTRRLHQIAIAEVDRQQARYPLRQGEKITAVPFDEGENVLPVSKKIYRLMIVVAGAGIILTMGFVIALDAVLRWRSNRQATGTSAAARQPDKQDTARVGSSPVAAPVAPSGPIRGYPPRPTDDAAVTQPAQSSGLSSTNGGSADTTVLPLRRNGDVVPAVAVEYRVTTVESPPPAGAGADGEGGEIRTQPSDATIVLPLSNAAWAGREQQERRDR